MMRFLPGCVATAVIVSGAFASSIPRATYSDGAHTLRLAPTPCDGPETCVYVELVERGGEGSPLLQQVWAFSPEGSEDQATIFTYPEAREAPAWPSPGDAAVGRWAAPEQFPPVDLEALVPMGRAELRLGEDGALQLSTARPLLFHRGEARSITMTVQASDSVTWVERAYGVDGDVIAERRLGLPRVEEFAPVVTTPDGLVIIDLRVGRGGELEAGDSALVGYRIFRANGQLVDSTSLPDRKEAHLQPAPGNLFEGFRRGVLGMRGTDRRPPEEQRHLRRLVVPAALAFGSRGASPLIGAGETLIVDIELHTFRDNTR